MDVIERIRRGFGAQLSSQFSRILARGAVILLLTRYFVSADAYGRLFLAISVLSVCILLGTLGIGKATGRYLAEYRKVDSGQVRYLIRFAFRYTLILTAIVVVALLVAAEPIARIVGSPSITPLLRLGSIYVVGNAITTLVTLIAQGHNRTDVSAAASIVANISLFVSVIALLLAGYGIIGVIAGYAIGFALASTFGVLYTYFNFYLPHDPDPAPEPGLRNRVLRYSVPISVNRGAIIIDTQIDTILLGFFSGPVSVGYYTLAKQISDFAIAPAQSLGFAISPTYGEQKSTGGLERAARMYETTLEYGLAVYVPAAVSLVLIADPFVRIVFGSDYVGAIPAVQVFAFFIILRGVDKLTNDALDYLGRARARAIARGSAAIGNGILNVILIPIYDVLGAAVATVITTTGLVAVELWVINNELNLDLRRLLKALLRVTVVTGGLAAILVPAISRIGGPITLVAVIATGIVAWGILGAASGILDIADLRAALG